MSYDRWAFTINNPSVDERVKLENLRKAVENGTNTDIGYLCYGAELGKEGNFHYQGYIRFNEKRQMLEVNFYLTFLFITILFLRLKILFLIIPLICKRQ